MSQTGWSWTKITERIGWLILIALAAAISWLLALRAFRMLLVMLGA